MICVDSIDSNLIEKVKSIDRYFEIPVGLLLNLIRGSVNLLWQNYVTFNNEQCLSVRPATLTATFALPARSFVNYLFVWHRRF